MRSDEEPKNSKRLEAAGELSAPVAHDINNLLSGILGFCDLLMSDHKAVHLRPHIKEISIAGKRIASMARMLLVFTRKGVNRPELLNVNVLIREIEKFIHYIMRSGIEFVSIYENSLWHVRADAAQMKRAILTLAIDIRDRMPKGGRFVLETKNLTLVPNAMQSSPDKPGNSVSIIITATGNMEPGAQLSGRITLENVRHFGTKTGLGMQDVFEAIQICGGEIFLDSNTANETRIQMYFPAIDPNSKA